MAAIKTGSIRVDGLRELSRALKSMDKDLGKDLQKANKSAASLVADHARAAAYSLGGVAAHVAPSLKASAGRMSASVSGGGATYPMFGGAEFGSIRYRQFETWRGSSSDAGYFLYPTIRRDVDQIVELYAEALDNLLGKAFPS